MIKMSATHLLSLYNTLRVFGVAPSACELYEEEVLVAHRDAAAGRRHRTPAASRRRNVR